MTYYKSSYNTYEFTAFTEADLLRAGDSNLGCGDTFTMPASASTCITVSDNDRYLSGDSCKNENSDDSYGQKASIANTAGHEQGNGGQIYAESYFWVKDQHGNWYVLIEIEQEGCSDDYFTFHSGYGMPPAGAQLTIVSENNVSGDWVDFNCLNAGDKVELGSVGGRLYLDADGDNTEWNADTNNWEAGVDCATVKLIDAHGNVVATTKTDHSGTYKFNDVAPGDYTVKFYNPDGTEFVQKNVGDDGADSDANANGQTDTITVGSGQHIWNVDAGVAEEPGSIKGRLFVDADGDNTEWNGQTHNWEAGVDGAKVELIDAHGNVVATTTTDHYGSYNFSDVEPGNYKIKFYNPDGTEFVKKDVGGAGEDSDAYADGLTDTICVGAGDDICNIDAGVKQSTGTISGTVFCDTGCDGINGELTIVPGQSYSVEAEHLAEHGFQVVTGANASGGKLVKLDCAGGNGTLGGCFGGKTGTYDLKIRVQDENDGQSTIKLLVNGCIVDAVKLDGDNNGGGDDNGGFSTYVFEDVDIKYGDEITLAAYGDCGEWVRIDKIDIEGEDTTVYTPDPVKEGVTIKLIDDAGNVVDTTVTDAHGNYTFDNVPVGDYKIMGVAPDGTEFTIKDAGSDDSIDSDVDENGLSDTVTVVADSTTDVDLGVCDIKEGSISGTVFCDSDCDGIQDTEVTLVKGENIFTDSVTFESVTCTTYNVDCYGAWTSTGADVIDLVVGADQGHNGNPHDNTLVELDKGGVWTRQFSVADGGEFCLVFDVYENSCVGAQGNTFKVKVNGTVVETVTVTEDGQVELSIDLVAGNNKIEFVSASDVGGYGAGIDDIEVLPLVEEVTQGEVKEGVTVKLIDASGVIVATTVTDVNGEYSFDNIPVGDYTIMGVAPDGTHFTIQDAGSDDTVDSDVDSNGMSGVITVTDGGNADVDLGLCEKEDPGSLSGRYFIDSNKDGLDNDGANGVAGVTVELLDAAGNPTGITTTTGANGEYSFTGLEPGIYGVKFTDAVTGLVLTTQDVDGNVSDDIDSDASDLGGGMSQITGIEVMSGMDTADNDAGVVDPGTASIGDTVWADTNGNGTLDAGEAGVDGVEVKLLADTDGDGDIDDVIDTTTTANGGQYLFENLDAGEYKVMFGTTGGLVFTTEGAAADEDVNNDSDAGVDGMTDTITLSVGEAEGDIDAGLVDPGTAAISGRVFVDGNDNSLDDGEPGVANVTVVLLNADGTPTGLTTTTDSNGGYIFTGLPAGSYIVDFDENDADLAGLVLVTQDVDGNLSDDVDSDASETNGQTGIITVAIGELSENNDAGVEDPGTAALGDTVFFDADGDGIQDAGEAGVADVTVTLTGAGADGVFGTADDTTATETTDGNGNYLFDGLDAGDYKVSFSDIPTGTEFTTQDNETGPDGDAGDSDADASGDTGVYSLGIGEVDLTADAGIRDAGTASISGRYFCDENDNDVDDGEPGIVGVTVTLLDAAGNTVATATTGANGEYSFTDLDAGTYSVLFDADPSGKTFVAQDDPNDNGDDTTDSDVDPNTGETGPIVLSIGETKENVDAGVEDPRTASVGDTVWLDANGNGVLDAGETGVDGIDVKLLADLDGDGDVDDVVATTTTSNGGDYRFNNLAAGQYAIMFVEPTGFDFTTPSAAAADAANDDSDSGLGGMTDVFDLAIGETELDIDAGLVAENGAPTLMDDELKTCADTPKGINVLLNDFDPEFDELTIIEVDGQSISTNGSITTSQGTIVTLESVPFLGSSLLVDASSSPVWDALDIGETGVENISYTVSDGNGNIVSANLAVTFCGDANTVEALCDTIPTGLVEYKVRASNVDFPIEEFGFDVQIVTAGGDARFEDVIFEEAYCLSLFDPADAAEDFASATLNSADMFCTGDAPADLFNASQISVANGLAAADNMDLVNWVLNQDYEDNGFTGWEVQRAIWELVDNQDTDYLSAIDAGFGDDANVDFIVSEALNNGEGFEAGVGDVVGIILDPNPTTPLNSQPFLVAVDWEYIDCLCIDNGGMVLT